MDYQNEEGTNDVKIQYIVMNAFVRFLVYSNLWIALGAGLVSYGNSINLPYAILLSSATLFLYSLLRIIKLRRPETREQQSPRQTWIENNSFLFNTVTLLSLLGVGYGLWYNAYLVYAPMLWILAAISLFYALPVIPYRGKIYAFREIPSLKVFLVGGVWGALCWYMPSGASIFSFLEGTFFIIAITIPFDIRDLELDAPSMKTLPQLIGKNKATLVAIIFLILAFVFVPGENKMRLLPTYLLTAILLYFVKNKKEDFYFSFLLDGVLLVYGINLLV